MIPTWYNTPTRISFLGDAARRWLRTPFRENSAVRGTGGGVACHNLAASLYFETGCMACFDVPRGRVRDFLKTGAGEAIVDYLDAHLTGRFAAVKDEPPLPGDLIVMREGRTAKHVGVVLAGGYFVHVLRPLGGVLLSRLDDSTYQPLVAIRRPLP